MALPAAAPRFGDHFAETGTLESNALGALAARRPGRESASGAARLEGARDPSFRAGVAPCVAAACGARRFCLCFVDRSMARRSALGARPRRSCACARPRRRPAAAARLPVALAQGGTRPDRPCFRASIASCLGYRRPPRQWDKGSGDAGLVESASPPRGASRGFAPHRRALATDGRSRSLCLARRRPGRAYRDGLCRGPRKICARRRGFRLALRHIAAQGPQDRRLDRSSSLYRQAAGGVEPWREPKLTTNRSPQRFDHRHSCAGRQS